ncbi:MAG TPA: hypothetical protein VMT03_13960 [Polyangia bacterium]|nr:hypothetical protein [Polyangia bacterium]
MTQRSSWFVACALAAAWGVGAGCGSDAASPPGGPVAAAGSGGASGAGGGGGGSSSTAASCPDAGGPVDPTAMIDDMEAPDPAILMEGGRNGGWWAGGDALSPNATIVPNGDAQAELIPNGGRCGSKYAIHVTGQGFTSWAEATASMRYGAVDGGAAGLLPYDAHTRTGITFWARIGDTSANQVRFAVSDKYTRPEGGVCDASVSTGSTACYDEFGVDLTQLSTRWTQYRIPFAGLGQRNFGLQEAALDTSAIYSVDFNFYVNEIFDFWVDDISFY